MAQFKLFFTAVLLVIGVVLGGSLPVHAQQYPHTYIAPDGRLSTYQMFCIGDCYAYVHIMIFTSAGRRMISFSQTSDSQNGVLATLGTTNWPILTDADGVITNILAEGFIRWHSNSAKMYPFMHQTASSQFKMEEHEANMVGVPDYAESGTVTIYLNITAPEPGSGS